MTNNSTPIQPSATINSEFYSDDQEVLFTLIKQLKSTIEKLSNDVNIIELRLNEIEETIKKIQ